MNETLQNSSPASAQSGALLAGAALAGGLLLSAGQAQAQTQKPVLTFESSINGTGDIKVLNYALALEALETDLYRQALLRLTTGGTNALGKRINGLGLSNSNRAVRYVRDFTEVEAAHQAFFESALGTAAITKGSNPLAQAKFDFGLDNNSTTLDSVLALLQTVEATGVGAYIGAIQFFSTTTYLQTAAAIQGTEARHTAVITALRNQISNRTDPVAPLFNNNAGIDQKILPNTVLSAVSGPNGFIVLPA
jgi:hypothetical protein